MKGKVGLGTGGHMVVLIQRVGDGFNLLSSACLFCEFEAIWKPGSDSPSWRGVPVI